MRRRTLMIIVAMVTALSAVVPIFAEDIPCQHEWTSWLVTEPPTCSTSGLETRYCTICYTTENQIVPATEDHDWDDWSVVKKSTVFKAGKKERECMECGKTQTKSIAKLKPFAKFKKSSYKLKQGKSKALKSQVKMAKGDSIKKWKSSKSSVATVSSSGKIKAKRSGTAKITVTLKSGKKATCKVKVTGSKSGGGSSSGSGTVYWVPNGSVYHCTKSCRTLSRSRIIHSGPLSSCPKSRPCKVCY